MPYKTYSEQITEHTNYLQSQGLDVTELVVDPKKWIRCHPKGESNGRGELAYITNTEKLDNGLLGIRTSFRGSNGVGSYKTYGLWPIANERSINVSNQSSVMATKTNDPIHEQVARRAYGFWMHSDLQGKSDYLDRKGVGHYGIRFRSGEQYGNVAVVPMFDNVRIWNYQLLNPDGKKRMAKYGRTEGLFHMLRKPVNGQVLGIAEGYVTSATCMELSGVATVCAFSSENLVAVTELMLSFFPASPIFIFADNDRHLVARGMENDGLLKAQQACNVDSGRVRLASPDFGELQPSKDASDWNDLIRLRGYEIAKSQIMSEVSQGFV